VEKREWDRVEKVGEGRKDVVRKSVGNIRQSGNVVSVREEKRERGSKGRGSVKHLLKLRHYYYH
jgi:hypothetical protein